MSDESANPVVEEQVKEEISPQAEETTPKQDVLVSTEEPKEAKKHPLEPGGDRFNQVWARSKKAEDEARSLREELQREREERIRLEERQRAKDEQTQEKEMTWAELEAGIEQGRWSRDQAHEYKDKMAERRLERKLQQKHQQESINSKFLTELEQYKAHIPDVMTSGSESRQKYERELGYMVRQLGMPDNFATQVAAARAAFGDLDTVKSRKVAKETVTSKESFQETHTPSRNKVDTKDFASTLQPHEKAHYEKMMRAGHYKDWKEVEDERNYKPKNIVTR